MSRPLRRRGVGLVLGLALAAAARAQAPTPVASPGAAPPAVAGEEPALGPARFPVPGALREVPGHGGDRAKGVPVRMRAVHSSWQLQPLLQHFADAFLAANLYLPPLATQPKYLREPQLTALDVERLVSYTVIFQPHGDGTTTVLYGEAALSQAAPPDVGLPLFPGSRGAIQTQNEAGRLVVYGAPGQPAEVMDFYRSTLPAGGWAPDGDGAWQRRGLRLQVGVSRSGQRTLVRLVETPVAAEAEAPPAPAR